MPDLAEFEEVLAPVEGGKAWKGQGRLHPAWQWVQPSTAHLGFDLVLHEGPIEEKIAVHYSKLLRGISTIMRTVGWSLRAREA